MKEKLIQYVDLLFAGAPGSEEIKQEILQNTLDRYDDLIAEGRSPENAYRMAISGIGDINEILGQGYQPQQASPFAAGKTDQSRPAARSYSPRKELCKSICHAVWVAALVLFILISFYTGAWLVTWLLFPIAGAIQGLIKAIFDLNSEGGNHS